MRGITQMALLCGIAVLVAACGGGGGGGGGVSSTGETGSAGYEHNTRVGGQHGRGGPD